jgi:hypothetical protein
MSGSGTIPEILSCLISGLAVINAVTNNSNFGGNQSSISAASLSVAMTVRRCRRNDRQFVLD